MYKHLTRTQIALVHTETRCYTLTHRSMDTQRLSQEAVGPA